MKAAELRPCDLCGLGLMHGGLPVFYRARFEVMGVDMEAVRERAGLGLILGGSAGLAEVFATRAEVANPIAGCDTLLVCHACAVDPAMSLPIGALAQRALEVSTIAESDRPR